MPAITGADLREWSRAQQLNGYERFEIRDAPYTGWELFQRNSEALMPDIQELARNRTAPSRTVSILDRNDFTSPLITSRVCTIPDITRTGGFTTVVFNTYGFAIDLIPADQLGTFESPMAAMEIQMKKGLQVAYGEMDAAAVAFLEASKNTVNAATVPSQTPVGGVSEFSLANKDLIWQDMPNVLGENDLPMESIEVLQSSNIQTEMMRLQNQGTSNAENRQWPFQQFGYTINGNRRIVNAAGDRSTHYYMPSGSVGTVTWVHKDAEANRTAGDRFWTTITDPRGLTWGVYSIEDCTGDQNYRQKMAVTLDVAYIVAYTSGGRAPIIKGVVKTV